MEYYKDVISTTNEKGLLRTLKTIENLDNGYCSFNGKRLLNLSSNDYLGLASNALLKTEFLEHLALHPEWLRFGSGSSRLLTGNATIYDETEEVLKGLYGSESALFFNSGYHANIGILPALTDKKDLILSDKLCHASIIDGIHLSQADHVRYRHLDYAQLENLLLRKRHQYRHVFIVSESVFSMDGDEANLQTLVNIKNKHEAFLYVDEAHSVGVRGTNGLGSCEAQNVTSEIDIIVGTLGKAIASVGAYAIFAHTFKQVLVNRARTLLFTTALPPINMAWSKFVLERLPQFNAQRMRLKSLSVKMSDALSEAGIASKASHIMPIVLGENELAVKMADHLQKEGFLVFPIRPPTVPENTARLRLSLTADLEMDQLEKVVQLIVNNPSVSFSKPITKDE